ncbi:MAG: hypothetical protein JRF33_05120 [Deltaproteobacteria bacterium]|nr:hypothetical protein [Deltaproteobacteria bacterium]
MKSKFLFLLALPTLLWACSTDQNLCQDDTCGPHGTCVAENGVPSCVCDEFYQPGPGLSCVPEPSLLIGQHCVDDTECISDRCLIYTGDTEGYCTTTQCLINSDCVNHAEGETNEMCCVEVDADFFLCLKAAEGYDCGSISPYICGVSCAGDPDICSPAFPCMGEGLDDPNAICSVPCATDADCSACEWSEDSNANIACVTIPGGDKYCLLDFPEPCRTSADCDEAKTCGIGIATDWTNLFGECMTVGALPPGSACDDIEDPNTLSFDERCRAFYCLGQMCTEVCEEDSDCPEDMTCEVLRFSDVDDEIKVCKGDPPCMFPSDCPAGENCWPTLTDEGGLEGRCRTQEGDLPIPCSTSMECPEFMRCGLELLCIGDLPCQANEDCPEGLICENGLFCTESPTCEVDEDCPKLLICGEDFFCIERLLCEVDEDCPEGKICRTFNLCGAEPCDDPNNLITARSCIADYSCNNPTDCSENDSCWPVVSTEGGLEGWCRANDGPDPVGTVCDESFDTCEVFCMEPLCTEWCIVDEDCPDTMVCEAINFCLAEPCTDPANSFPGTVCIKDYSCDAPTDCDDGYSCWPALTAESDLDGLCRLNEGPGPVGTFCDAAHDNCEVFCIEPRCTEWCTVDEDCPDTMICQAIDFCLAEPCDDPENMAAGTVCTVP